MIAEYDFHWQNMQPIKSVLPFCSALPIQYNQNNMPRLSSFWVGLKKLEPRTTLRCRQCGNGFELIDATSLSAERETAVIE